MSITNRKDRTTIRFNSVGIWLKDGSTDHENLGEEMSAKLSLKENIESITLMSGNVLKRRGSRECTVSVVLAQDNKSVLDRIDALHDKTFKLIIDNGSQGGKKQAYFFPQAEIVSTYDIELAGAKHQSIAVEILISPQDAAFTCAPSTDFPASMGFLSSTPISNANPFYIVAEE
jgi:hypothetical protein